MRKLIIALVLVQKGSLISFIEMQTEAVVAAVVQLPFHIRQEMKRGLTKSCSRPVCQPRLHSRTKYISLMKWRSAALAAAEKMKSSNF